MSDDARTVHRVLFVCTGNTCRSPLAEVIGREGAARRGLNVDFRSAGIAAAGGVPASEGSEIVARRHGLDLGGHRAEQFTPDVATATDLILAMDENHLRLAERMAPDVPRRLVTEYLPEEDVRRGEPVPDPFGGWTDLYEETYLLLEACIAGLLEALAEAEGPPERS